MSDLSEEELQELYTWIDEIPLSRQKKNITRDFSDGVLAAEVVHHFLPRLVELHNYSPANATQQKIDNWKTLNRKVFSRLKFCVSEELMQGVVVGKAGVIEFILTTLRTRIESYLQNVAQTQNLSSESPLITPSQDSHHQLINPNYQIQNGLSWIQGQEVGPRQGGVVQFQDTFASPQSTHHSKKQLYQTASKPPVNPLHISHNSYHQVSRIPVPINRHDPAKPHPSGSTQLLPPLLESSSSKSTLPGAGVTSYGGIAQSRKPVAPAPAPARRLSRESTMAMRIKLAEKDQQLLQTQEFIQYLQMKLTRYEHLVQIKDMKIESLKRDLESARNAVRQTQLLQRPYQRR